MDMILTEVTVVQLKTLSESLKEITQNTTRNLNIADRGLNNGLHESWAPGPPPSREVQCFLLL